MKWAVNTRLKKSETIEYKTWTAGILQEERRPTQHKEADPMEDIGQKTQDGQRDMKGGVNGYGKYGGAKGGGKVGGGKGGKDAYGGGS